MLPISIALVLSSQLQAPQPLVDVSGKYGVAVEIIQKPYSYNSSYKVEVEPPNQPDLEKYAALFAKEWNRYPISAIKTAKLKRIVIGSNIRMDGQVRAAVPAFEAHTMFYDTSLGAKSPDYQRNVIHHEFFHLIDELQGHMRKDPEWAALNPMGFKYGNGGENMRTSGVGELTDKLPGFITPYSTSAIEEDKAEIFAHLLVDRGFVQARAEVDSVVAAKVDLLKKRMQAWDASLDERFWETPNSIMSSPNRVCVHRSETRRMR